MHNSVKKLYSECATLNVRLIDKLPLNLHFLIWSSPTSVRNPESSILWQPLHSKKQILARLLTYSIIIGISTTRGLYKFIKYKGFYSHHIKNKSPILLIIPDVIVDDSAGFKTNYLIEDDDYPVDKLLFAYSRKRLKQGVRFSTLNYNIKIILFLKLFTVLFYDLVGQLLNKKVTWRYLDAMVLFASWILSLSWCFVWDFYHMLNNSGISNYNKHLLVLHEMHFYSRVVWTIAKEKGLSGIAVQHALIIPEKLWYFPDKSEIKANCPLPGRFFVYSDETRELLQPLYQSTIFQKCCSPRFKHWKKYFASEHHVSESVHNKDTMLAEYGRKSNKRVILIVNNAAIFHDIVVIKAMYRLIQLELDDDISLRFRPHPNERLCFLDRLRIQLAVKLCEMEISSKPLSDDFKDADLVVGANSTVVQEAALMGSSVMGVCDDDYIASSILPPSFLYHVNKLSRDVLAQCMVKKNDDLLIERLKANIGIFNPDLTTKLIFDLCAK